MKSLKEESLGVLWSVTTISHHFGSADNATTIYYLKIIHLQEKIHGQHLYTQPWQIKKS